MRVTNVWYLTGRILVTGYIDGDDPIGPDPHFVEQTTGRVIKAWGLGFLCNTRMTPEGREWPLSVPAESARYIRAGTVLDKLPPGRTTPELTTDEQALEYLDLMSPGTPFRLYRFSEGWVFTRVLTQEELDSGAGLGLAHSVLDAETGHVYGYPSWPVPMVAETFTEDKQNGRLTPLGRQYPRGWWLTAEKQREDDTTAEYRVTAESLLEPPEPTVERLLTVAKQGYDHRPTDTHSAMAASHLRWAAERADGVWPDKDETAY